MATESQSAALPAWLLPALAGISFATSILSGALSMRWHIPSMLFGALFMASFFGLVVFLPVVAYSVATDPRARNWRQGLGLGVGLIYLVGFALLVLSWGG